MSITKEAIDRLAQAEAITAANKTDLADSVIALPSDFRLHHMEPYNQLRQRPRGKMTTSVLEHFGAYVERFALEGATVFVDIDDMEATAVLNLGTDSAPGHADNTAVLKAKATAAYMGLERVKRGDGLERVKLGDGMSQQSAAEWFEDYAPFITCYQREGDDERELPLGQVVQAVRKLTIEGLRKLESSEQSLSASKTLMEQVAVKNEQPLPTRVVFRCVPFLGLEEREFTMRLGVSTARDNPRLVLRVQNEELHQEEMGQEFADLIQGRIAEAADVVVGSYQKAA